MLNFIKNKTNLSILIFYFIFSFSSLLFILLAEYNNNKTPTLFLKQFVFYAVGFGIIYLLQKIPITYIEKFSIAFYLFALVLLVGIFLVPPTLAPNSEGCKVNSPRLYQLRAPFTIGAKLLGTKNIPTKRTSANK